MPIVKLKEKLKARVSAIISEKTNRTYNNMKRVIELIKNYPINPKAEKRKKHFPFSEISKIENTFLDYQNNELQIKFNNSINKKYYFSDST